MAWNKVEIVDGMNKFVSGNGIQNAKANLGR
jgi:hypothetical protein